MTWNEVSKEDTNHAETSKNTTRYLKKRSARGKVYRGAFGKFNTRGEIAKEIHGDAGATVTRKDMQDRFGTKVVNNFTGKDKESSSWSEVEKE